MYCSHLILSSVVFFSLAFTPVSVFGQQKGASKKSSEAVEATTATCGADVFYSWKRTGPSAEGDLAKPVEVFFIRLEREGGSEQSVRETLQARLTAAQKDALRECSEEHGEKSRCVAKLLRTSGKEYQSFDFQTRNLFLKSVEDECEKKTGVCLSTRASDIACRVVSASIEDSAAKNGAKGKSKK